MAINTKNATPYEIKLLAQKKGTTKGFEANLTKDHKEWEKLKTYYKRNNYM